eukprot:6259598-Amphidinium_carterae.1
MKRHRRSMLFTALLRPVFPFSTQEKRLCSLFLQLASCAGDGSWHHSCSTSSNQQCHKLYEREQRKTQHLRDVLKMAEAGRKAHKLNSLVNLREAIRAG